MPRSKPPRRTRARDIRNAAEISATDRVADGSVPSGAGPSLFDGPDGHHDHRREQPDHRDRREHRGETAA
jgi:hypothetical protein